MCLFYANFLLDNFSSRTFFDFSSDFFTFSFFIFERSLLLQSKAYVNRLQSKRVKFSVAQWLVIVAVVREVSGSNPVGGQVFCSHKEKSI